MIVCDVQAAKTGCACRAGRPATLLHVRDNLSLSLSLYMCVYIYINN